MKYQNIKEGNLRILISSCRCTNTIGVYCTWSFFFPSTTNSITIPPVYLIRVGRTKRIEQIKKHVCFATWYITVSDGLCAVNNECQKYVRLGQWVLLRLRRRELFNTRETQLNFCTTLSCIIQVIWKHIVCREKGPHFSVHRSNVQRMDFITYQEPETCICACNVSIVALEGSRY